MNLCADQKCEKSDAGLHELYKPVMNRLKGNARTAKLLVAAQRARITFRDADCAVSTSTL